MRRVGAWIKLDLACVVHHNGSGGGLYNNDAVRPHIDDVDRAQARLDVVKACAKRERQFQGYHAVLKGH